MVLVESDGRLLFLWVSGSASVDQMLGSETSVNVSWSRRPLITTAPDPRRPRVYHDDPSPNFRCPSCIKQNHKNEEI
ncbi:hypothetical protein E2C01_011136 [Portunus trituberculatus]|uniref:Uncharacterized protein n=1 Tax=Portunus trituberculatus TaxID=210409 RepID=A0A5B7DAI7_PORTR|nr:hypothetical protein [Portunus trituberculatus]